MVSPRVAPSILTLALWLLVTTQGLAGGYFWAMRSLDLDKNKGGGRGLGFPYLYDVPACIQNSSILKKGI